MNSEQITRADLMQFKFEIIAEMRQLLKGDNAAPTKKWMKSREVRKILGVCPGTLQTMRKSNVITFTRIGGSIYYDEADIYRMYEQNKVKSKSKA